MHDAVDHVVKVYTSATKKEFDSGAKHVVKDAFRALIFNVTSLACVVTLLNGKKSIETSDLKGVRAYITAQCGPSGAPSGQRGGGSMPSDYFGYPHPSYGSTETFQAISEINFLGGIARPAMGPQTGGGHTISHGMDPKDSNAAQDLIKSVARHHGLMISDDAVKELLYIMDVHIACLTKDLGRSKTVSKTRVSKILSQKRHAIFN